MQGFHGIPPHRSQVLSLGFLEAHESWRWVEQPSSEFTANPGGEWDGPDTTLTLAFDRNPTQHIHEPLNLDLNVAPLYTQDALPIVPSEQHQTSTIQPIQSLPLDERLDYNSRRQVASHASFEGGSLTSIFPIFADDYQAFGSGGQASMVSDWGPFAMNPPLVHDFAGVPELSIDSGYHQDFPVSDAHPETSNEFMEKFHPFREEPSSDLAHLHPTVSQKALVDNLLELELQNQSENKILYEEEGRFLEDPKNYSLNFPLKTPPQWVYYRKLQQKLFRLRVGKPVGEPATVLLPPNRLIYEKGDHIGKNMMQELGLPLPFSIDDYLKAAPRITLKRLDEWPVEMMKIHSIAEDFFPHALPFVLTGVRAVCYAFPLIPVKLQKTVRQLQIEAYAFYENIRRELVDNLVDYGSVFKQQIKSNDVLPQPIITNWSQELLQHLRWPSRMGKETDDYYRKILIDCRFLIGLWIDEKAPCLFPEIVQHDRSISSMMSSILNQIILNFDS